MENQTGQNIFERLKVKIDLKQVAKKLINPFIYNSLIIVSLLSSIFKYFLTIYNDCLKKNYIFNNSQCRNLF